MSNYSLNNYIFIINKVYLEELYYTTIWSNLLSNLKLNKIIKILKILKIILNIKSTNGITDNKVL